MTKKRVAQWVVGAGVGAVLIVCGVQTAVIPFLVRSSDRRAARDSSTGVLVGAEARDLGPEDATAAVLLVHGFLGAGSNFADLPDRLARCGWRVRVMRLPGHGTSPMDLRKVSADELERSVAEELTALRAHHKKVALIGLSMGGALATIAASRVPVDALVLGAPYFGVTYHWYYGLRLETWNRLASPLVPWIYKGHRFVQVNRKEAKSQVFTYPWVPTSAVNVLTEIGRRANRAEVLDNVKCPVLLVHSRADEAASPEAAARAFGAIASNDKRALWLTRSNHVIFWDLEREQVGDEIQDFLEPLMR